MTSRRLPWLAALLTLLTPGLGHLYAGRPRAAARFAVLVAAACWAMVGTWVLLPPSLLGVLIGWLLALGVWATVATHAAATARRAGSTYERRSYNRWYVYLGAAIFWSLVWQQGVFGPAQTHVAQPFRIPSPAMEPTLLVGDFVYVAKLPVALRTPERDALVVFLLIEDSTPTLHIVKRVTGIPGDTLRMVRDTIYRNGTRLDEPYARRGSAHGVSDPEERRAQIHAWQLGHYVGADPTRYRPTTHDWGPIVVPPERCFVLGDHRDQSYDSRYYGFVPFASVRGRPRVVYFSYDRQAGKIRWERIGRAIH